jgi:membrane-associated phospholipid phosphatase
MSCDPIFTTITWLGSLYLLLPFSAIFALFLLWAGRPREILMLGLSLLVTVALVHVAKLIFQRPRPDSLELLVPMPTDWSFPSAHTAQATAVFLSVAIIAIRSLPPVWGGIVAVASTLIIIGVGWSRLYLHVHYLSDVIAGCALAVIIVTAVHLLLPYRHTLGRD